MNEIEKKIAKQFKTHKNDDLPDFDKLWYKIEDKRSRKEMRSWKKYMIATAAALVILSLGGVKAGPFIASASESLLSKIFGEDTLQQVDPEATLEDYNELENILQLAENKLSDEEFSDFSNALQEATSLVSKATTTENGQAIQSLDLLSKTEQERLSVLEDKIQTYMEKVEGTASEKIAKANFPVHELNPVPEGFELTNVYVNESHDGQPLIRKIYARGEYVLMTIQSGILTEDLDEFSLINPENVVELEENGVTILYGTNPGSDVERMKAVIKDSNGKPHYQIFISANASVLSKQDMKDIILQLAGR